MKVELYVEELVLQGIGDGTGPEIAAAAQDELERLIMAKGLGRLLRHPTRRQSVDAGAFEVAPRTRDGAVGRRLAQSVHYALTISSGGKNEQNR